MRTLLIASFLFWMGNSLEAQKNFSAGISYAPTFARIDQQNNPSKNHRYGQQVSLQARWNSGKHFSYMAGLGYSAIQSEYSSKIPYIGEIYTQWFKHQDILLPFQLRYSFSTKPSRLFFSGGIIPSINVGRKVLENRQDPYGSPSIGWDTSDEQGYRAMDCFITLGLGYEYTIKGVGQFYIQPDFRTNFLTELAYIPKYLFHRQDEVYPLLVSTIGIEVGYFLK